MQDPPGAYMNNYGGRVRRIGNVSACFLSILCNTSPLAPAEDYGVTVPDEADWRRRDELRSLLRMCRARNTPHDPGTGSIRQQDAAALAGLSVRSYAALETRHGTSPVRGHDRIGSPGR